MGPCEAVCGTLKRSVATIPNSERVKPWRIQSAKSISTLKGAVGFAFGFLSNCNRSVCYTGETKNGNLLPEGFADIF